MTELSVKYLKEAPFLIFLHCPPKGIYGVSSSFSVTNCSCLHVAPLIVFLSNNFHISDIKRSIRAKTNKIDYRRRLPVVCVID
jgi:hypothetical protein